MEFERAWKEYKRQEEVFNKKSAELQKAYNKLSGRARVEAMEALLADSWVREVMGESLLRDREDALNKEKGVRIDGLC